MRKGSVAIWIAMVISLAAPPTRAQSVRSLVNGGNDLYNDQKYTDAEVNYRKALEKEKELVQGHFNLGNALHKEGKYGDAVREFDIAREKAAAPETRAHAWYNIGNSLMQEQKYQEAVDAYIKSLQTNPYDQEAKYNLSYALEKLKQQQQQQKQQNKNQDKKNQKQNQDQKNQDQKQKQDQQKQDQKKQDQQQNPQQNQAQQQEKKMSRADAERILGVLENNEKEVQKKLRVRQAVRPKTEKDW